MHWKAALWVINRPFVAQAAPLWGKNRGAGALFSSRSIQLECLFFAAVAQDAVVAYPHKAVWHNMHGEAPDELPGVEPH